MATLNLHGELGRRLTIEVNGYENEAAMDVYDANWLRCSAEVEVGRFRGAIDASFATQDFARFLSELDQVVEGASLVASFHPMEEALLVRVEVDRAGRLTITGKLREIDENGPTLSFAIESDLSFLGLAQAELKRIVLEFPERAARASSS
jgi:hypothetical protein